MLPALIVIAVHNISRSNSCSIGQTSIYVHHLCRDQCFQLLYFVVDIGRRWSECQVEHKGSSLFSSSKSEARVFWLHTNGASGPKEVGETICCKEPHPCRRVLCQEKGKSCFWVNMLFNFSFLQLYCFVDCQVSLLILIIQAKQVAWDMLPFIHSLSFTVKWLSMYQSPT